MYGVNITGYQHDDSQVAHPEQKKNCTDFY